MTATAMIAYFDSSPKPSVMMNSGSSATFGMGKVRSISGCTNARIQGVEPIARPIATPGTPPSRNPITIRLRLAARCAADLSVYVGTYCQPMIPSIYQPVADQLETVHVIEEIGAGR